MATILISKDFFDTSAVSEKMSPRIWTPDKFAIRSSLYYTKIVLLMATVLWCMNAVRGELDNSSCLLLFFGILNILFFLDFEDVECSLRFPKPSVVVV